MKAIRPTPTSSYPDEIRSTALRHGEPDVDDDDLRETMLAGFAAVLEPEVLATLDALVPRHRWRTVLPSGFWYRRAVLDQVDERQRRNLHAELDRVIGPDAAAATMEFLPPVPWDVLQDQGVDGLLMEAVL